MIAADAHQIIFNYRIINNMSSTIHTETETVIKRILPYLRRRGYNVEEDLDFETGVKTLDRYNKGYIDILVSCGKPKPLFLIEAKKSSRILNSKDRDQAVSYAKGVHVPFVVVTNGRDIQCINAENKQLIRWNGKSTERIPTKEQLKSVSAAFKTNKDAIDVPLGNDKSLPFRPGLPLKQLNALFARCHNAIRKIEKNEEFSFADFSKLLFLKLLEEKSDMSDFVLPYSYRFHELAQKPDSEKDQIRDAIQSMIEEIKKKTPYAEVLEDPLHLRVPLTFKYIVTQLASVSFQDSSLDSKGAAFEYFVRATLKGKKLGQYFTPRQLVELMATLVGREKIINSVLASSPIKVYDPACGTGGFLVFLMQENFRLLDKRLQDKQITQATFNSIKKKLTQDVFYGSDANEGVACAAKMNMIIMGDGHSNIQREDSLARSAMNWSLDSPDCDIILTNPPFGTSESESLSARDLADYPIKTTKGQLLFLQKMVLSTVPGGDICTVIDEGVLNTDAAKPIRQWLLKNCVIRAVISLPDETFKPNKINVKSSILYMTRRKEEDLDLELNYLITFSELQSLGYDGSSDHIRGFDFKRLLDEVNSSLLNYSNGPIRSGYNWDAFDVASQHLIADNSIRFDTKYWHPEMLQRLEQITHNGGISVEDINVIGTHRGKSPSADLYVDAEEGYALVVKAGTNISRFGELLTIGDYIEKNLYDEMEEVQLKKGDVLLSSTGDGTLGKCCVYRSDIPAIADGHVTIIRVNPEKVHPEYLCDYLRIGFGSDQVARLYSGSTGLIELSPQHVDSIIVDLPAEIVDQKKISSELREKEKKALMVIEEGQQLLVAARSGFPSENSKRQVPD